MTDAGPDPASDPASEPNRQPGPEAEHESAREVGRHVGRHVVGPGTAGGGDDPEQVGGAHALGPVEPTFPAKPLLRTGYDRGAVDEFVAKVVLAVHQERQTSVTADQVARTRFPPRRLGPGYRMRDVDDYLGVAEALLRMRAAAHGVGPEPEPRPEPEHRHHPTWWIYGIAVVLAVVVVVFTLTQT